MEGAGHFLINVQKSIDHFSKNSDLLIWKKSEKMKGTTSHAFFNEYKYVFLQLFSNRKIRIFWKMAKKYETRVVVTGISRTPEMISWKWTHEMDPRKDRTPPPPRARYLPGLGTSQGPVPPRYLPGPGARSVLAAPMRDRESRVGVGGVDRTPWGNKKVKQIQF